MSERNPLVPESVWRIYEMSAKIPSPVGHRFLAKTDGGSTKVYLYDLIGEGLSPTSIGADALVKELDAAQANGSRSLEIFVNSPGGIIGDGMAMYEAVRRFKGSRTVYVDGWAASIASVIALAGDRVISGVGSTWMIHEPMGMVLAAGRRDQIRASWEKTDAALAALHESILDLYESRTKQPRATLDAWMRAETYMTAQEAMERGFADSIAGDDDKRRSATRAAALMEAPPPPARASTPEELFARAMADAADIARRFPAASRGAQNPGQPGAPMQSNTTPVVRQEK